MQKLNRYLLETDEQRAERRTPRRYHGGSDESWSVARTKEMVFKLIECSLCGWNIDPTTPHWMPTSGHAGGVYHIGCYKPEGYNRHVQSRQGWQCFCGHCCSCEEYANKTGYLGAGCERCGEHHYGQDRDYDFPQGIPHPCSLCGWAILPIETPILNKNKKSNYPPGWMHECCYNTRYDELMILDKEYNPITVVLPRGEEVEVDLNDLDEYQRRDVKMKAKTEQWKRSTKVQKNFIEELRIWQRFGVERTPK